MSLDNNNRRNVHHHHNKAKKHHTFSKNTIRIIICVLFVLMFCTLLFIGSKSQKKETTVNNESEYVFSTDEADKYVGILTVIDGEGEDTFTETGGNLLSKGYPICSNLVIDNIGEEGYMDWETIESLSNIKVNFIFHQSHKIGSEYTTEKLENYIKEGIALLDKHSLNSSLFVWRGIEKADDLVMAKQYFDGGFTMKDPIKVIEGDRSNKLNVEYYYDASNYSLAKLTNIIDVAKSNHGWAVLFTRNNSEYMNEEQLSIFEKAFEYAKENNVGIVSPFEGFDLYFNDGLNK